MASLDNIVACASCKFLGSETTKWGIIPLCHKNKIKFKERVEVDYQAKDLLENKCELFEHFKNKKH